MAHPVAPTALPGQSKSAADLLARGLGYFSIGLGVAQLLAPRAVGQAVGLDGQDTLIRAYGAREVATGVAILSSHNPQPWIWGRVAGDAVDIATVATALRADNPKENNAIAAVGMLVGITVLDAVCAAALTREKGGRSTATVEYSDRVGFPRGLAGARGTARDFEVPRDFRTPDPLRGDLFQQQRAVRAGAA